MVRPERRTKGDLLAAATIALVVVVVAALFWWNSSARATISRPATSPAPTIAPARVVPDTLRPLWTASSPRTLSPIVVFRAAAHATGPQHLAAVVCDHYAYVCPETLRIDHVNTPLWLPDQLLFHTLGRLRNLLTGSLGLCWPPFPRDFRL